MCVGQRLALNPSLTENLIIGFPWGRRRQVGLGKPLSRRQLTPPWGTMVSPT